MTQGNGVRFWLWFSIGLVNLLAIPLSTTVSAAPQHGLALHGELKYPADFERFDYTSASATKGGQIKLAATGTFDSFNSFIAKGTQAADIGLIYDSLMVASADEPFARYGLVAKSADIATDGSHVTFSLNPNARFHDHHAIEAEDVAFTFNLLLEKGHPFYRAYYVGIDRVEVLGIHQVRFYFKDRNNRELPLIVAELPVLPKHYWQHHDFAKSSLSPPLGSGPYQIGKLEAGQWIQYDRVKDYWAKDLPVRRGMYNFDHIRYDYYRDGTVALEALKAGEYDYRLENSSKQWATAYRSPAIDAGQLKTLELRHENPTGMQAFIMNLRRPLFQDQRVREALSLAFDFEWANKSLFYDAYTRTDSYFSNSELASSGLPQGRELEILQAFRQQLPASVFEQPYQVPTTDGSGRYRKNLRLAKKRLEQAGWKVIDNQLTHQTSGQTFNFEILLVSPAFERIVNPYVKQLQKLGIAASVRTVDVSQYTNRVRSFDFDMMVAVMGQSQSPGNEQRGMWHSSTAEIDGSRNYMGLQNPVVDALVEQLIAASNRSEQVAHARALDRVLLHHHYVVPHWHIRHHRLAFWDKFNRPQTSPPYDSGHQTGLLTWWYTPTKAAQLQKTATP